MVPKTNGEIYVSISIGKVHNYIHLFSALCQKRSCCWRYQKWDCHLKHRYWKNIYTEAVENARINFSVSPYRTLWLARKENLKIFEVTLAVVLCNDVVGSIMNMWGYLHWNTANTIPDIYLLFVKQNCHKNTQTRCKVCSNLSSVLQQLTFVLIVIFINLEHLFILLFKLWKGKCWLEVRCELLSKILQQC